MSNLDHYVPQPEADLRGTILDTNAALTRVPSESPVNRLIRSKMQASKEQTETRTEPGHVYVVRVYQYKARKHQVRFLGRSIRTKKVALTNLASAYAFTYGEAAEIIAETGSVEGKQFTIMLLTEAVEREAIRANKK